jgi:hypothetical protein
MELATMGLQIGAIGTNAVARATAGLGAWIITNFSAGAGAGAAPVMSGNAGGNPLDGYPTTAAVAGTPRAFTEALLKTAMQNVWTQGGDPKCAFMNATQKIAFSAFAGIATRFRDVPAGKQAQIIGAADLYVGDFGTVSVVPDRFMPTSIVYVGDPEYASLSYLRNFSTTTLAQTGDNHKRMIICEWGLRVRQQKSWAAIADLS